MQGCVLTAATALLLALSGGASAADAFSGDGRTFSGVASDSGQGLILPQSLVADGRFSFGLEIDTSFIGPVTVVAGETGGLVDEGLAAFPAPHDLDAGFVARFTPGEVMWGLTPYVGVNVEATAVRGGPVFQGIPQLLPFESGGASIQGVAGIAYELMPGIGAGIEYRYHSYTAPTPVVGDGADSQTIMMRLDLGLN